MLYMAFSICVLARQLNRTSSLLHHNGKQFLHLKTNLLVSAKYGSLVPKTGLPRQAHVRPFRSIVPPWHDGSRRAFQTLHEKKNDICVDDAEVENVDYENKENEGDVIPSSESAPSLYGKRKTYKSDLGKTNDYTIVDYFEVPGNGLQDNDVFQNMFSSKDQNIASSNHELQDDTFTVTQKPTPFQEVQDTSILNDHSNRLKLTHDNVTLPVALVSLRPKEYSSLSKARKACRNGLILIHRGPLAIDPVTNETSFVSENCIRGRVSDRIYPSDVIAKQVRTSGAFYPDINFSKPPFDMPVVYEDDHMAIVNKPAGVVVYSQRKHRKDRMTVRGALPFVLRQPAKGTMHILRRPASVHRLDKPTSGLLLIAKTKPAMIHLTRQFLERRIKKTYTAIVNGIPDEPIETSISSVDAREMYNVHIKEDDGDDDEEHGNKRTWQLIDSPLDGKNAVTLWRALKYSKSLKADQQILTLVELKPRTGRFHQLRQHMAWTCGRPIIGDNRYDGGHESALDFRQNGGLFLCSNEVVLEHPFYNTEEGKELFRTLMNDNNNESIGSTNVNGQQQQTNTELCKGKGMVRWSKDGSTVEVYASIDLPSKFDSLMKREEERFLKFHSHGNTLEER